MIRKRDERCVRCGDSFGLQCAHKVSRRYLATRWSPANAVALCVKCHMWQTHNPLEGDEFFDGLVSYIDSGHFHLYSPLRMDQLRQHALNDPVPDLDDVISHLKEAGRG